MSPFAVKQRTTLFNDFDPYRRIPNNAFRQRAMSLDARNVTPNPPNQLMAPLAPMRRIQRRGSTYMAVPTLDTIFEDFGDDVESLFN